MDIGTPGNGEGVDFDEIELRPFYHDIKNSIVQPKQIVVGTRYFWEKWAPRLRPTLTTLIIRLRMHCYYNRDTQERRDWCFPTQQTLAQEVGISRWTVMRELKRPEAKLFVRVQYRSRYDPARKQTVRISSLYHVAMDDPLVEEDQGRAALLAAECALAEAESRSDSHCGLVDPGRERAETPFTGSQAKRLITQVAKGPSRGKLPHEDVPGRVSEGVDVVARELMAENVSERAALQLAQHFPAERIREKMALVRRLQSDQVGLRNTPGFLRKAIEDDYRQPLAATGTDDVAPLVAVRPALGARVPAAASLSLSDRSGNLNPWEVVKQALEPEMTAAAFQQWLQPSKLLHYEMGHMAVVVTDGRMQRYIEQRLRPQIQALLVRICSGPVELEVIVEED